MAIGSSESSSLALAAMSAMAAMKVFMGRLFVLSKIIDYRLRFCGPFKGFEEAITRKLLN